MPVLQAASRLRSDLLILTSDASSRVRSLLARPPSADAAKELLLNELPPMLELYSSAAGTVAADWYDDLRAAERIPGRFRATVARNAGGIDELVAWGLSPVFKDHPDWAAALQLVVGGLQRRILASPRETITGASIADRQSLGWQRATRPGACTFCVMLADRGAVYRAKTADFGAHDNCHCVAMPAWESKGREVRAYQRSKRWDRRSADQTMHADQARAKAWMEANYGTK